MYCNVHVKYVLFSKARFVCVKCQLASAKRSDRAISTSKSSIVRGDLISCERLLVSSFSTLIRSTTDLSANTPLDVGDLLMLVKFYEEKMKIITAQDPGVGGESNLVQAPVI